MTNHDNLQPAVVMVADRTLSARYRVLFEGIFATMQTSQVPQLAMRHFVAPPVRCDRAGRAALAPLGLRRLESSLRASGLGEGDVVCATPESLGRLLGPWTRIVAVSSSDPLGIGMTNTTTTQFWKGELYTKLWMERLLDQISQAKAKWPFTVVGGGGGAWQWVQNPDRAAAQGIDIVFDGYFENVGPAMFLDLLKQPAGRLAGIEGMQGIQPTRDGDGQRSRVVREEGTAAGSVKPILHPTVLGAIELSRGCGKGCRFCTSARRAMEHLDEGIILADVETNIRGGARNLVSGSEDFFRYGSSGSKVNFERLRQLLESMRRIDGIDFMQIDHGNVSSVLQFSDDELREIRRLLSFRKKTDYMWVNMGIESASGSLVSAHSPGKMSPFASEDWPDMVRKAADTMTRTGFFPVFSLILGLPGETQQDVRRTLDLVNWLAQRRAVVFPIFHEPVLSEARRGGEAFGLPNMTPLHLELYTACYEVNFRWVPKLFWDNQRAGSAPLARRALVQMLGKLEVRSWRRNFARLRKRMSPQRTQRSQR